MVKYHLVLQVKDFPNSKESPSAHNQYAYEIDLSVDKRNNPTTIFTDEERRNLRSSLENKSRCRIGDTDLDHIIKTWLLDIQEDYRHTHIVLYLSSLLVSNVSDLQEQGYQSLPRVLPPNITDIEPVLGMLPPLNFC